MKKALLTTIFILALSISALGQVIPDLEEIYSCFPIPDEAEVFYSTLNHSIYQHPDHKEIKAFRDIIQHQHLYWLGMPKEFTERLYSYSRGIFGHKSGYEVLVFRLYSPGETISRLFNVGDISKTDQIIAESEVYLFPMKQGHGRTMDYYLLVVDREMIFMSNDVGMLEKMVQVKEGKLPPATSDPRFAQFTRAADKPCFDFTLISNTMAMKKQLMDVKAKKEQGKAEKLAIAGMTRMLKEGPQTTFEFTAWQEDHYVFERYEEYGSERYAANFLTYNNSKAEEFRQMKGHRDYWELRMAKTIWQQKGKLVIGRLVFDQLLIDKARDWWSDQLEEDNPEEEK